MKDLIAVIALIAWWLATGWICLFVIRIPE